MATLKANKKNLRKVVSAVLGALSSAEIQAQSQAIISQVISASFFQRSRAVSCYLSMPAGEMDTTSLVSEILRAGKTLFVPKIDVTANSRMDFLKIYDDEDLQTLPSGVWGIKEPDYEYHGSRRESALESSNGPLDLILLPGVAFDTSLSRLGHGKGYYDRFITNYTSTHGRKPLLVALALREQILEAGRVPTGEYDWKVDIIVGPDGIVRKGDESASSS